MSSRSPGANELGACSRISASSLSGPLSQADKPWCANTLEAFWKSYVCHRWFNSFSVVSGLRGCAWQQEPARSHAAKHDAYANQGG